MKINIAPYLQRCWRSVRDTAQRCWRHICAVWLDIREIPGKIRQLWRREKPIRADFTPEMEAIMNKLIRSTVGTGGALDREFLRQSAQFDKDRPIGEEEARELIRSLLKLAIANRDKLNGRIEHSVEFGSLYYRYYSKLQTVYALTVAANNKREELEDALREYHFAYNVYANVRSMTYVPEMTKKNNDPSIGPPPAVETKKGGKTV